MPRLGDKITAVTGGNSGIGVANSNSLGMRMTTAGMKDIVHEIGRLAVNKDPIIIVPVVPPHRAV